MQELKTAEQPTSQAAASLNWRPSEAIGLTVLIYFAAQYVGGFLLVIYPLLKGWDAKTTEAWLANSTFAQFWLIVLIELITLGLLAAFLKKRQTSKKSLGLVRPRLKDIGWSIGGALVYLPLVIAATTLAKKLLPTLNLEQQQQIGFNNARSRPELLLVLIGLVVLPALVEEILVRGFLYGVLRRYWPKVQAAFFVSLLFGLAHLQFNSGAPLLWVAGIDTFVLSLVLVYLRQKSGSLWPAIWLHMAKNTVAFISLFLIK